jgi:hypothetical protein
MLSGAIFLPLLNYCSLLSACLEINPIPPRFPVQAAREQPVMCSKTFAEVF